LVWTLKSGTSPVQSEVWKGGHMTSSQSLRRGKAKSWRLHVRPKCLKQSGPKSIWTKMPLRG
jgi:hypothetical protein